MAGFGLRRLHGRLVVRVSGGIDRLSEERALPTHIQDTIHAAREYAEAARAPNTLRAYDSDVRDFSTYCKVELGGAWALPATPETLTLYITDMALAEPRGRGPKTGTKGDPGP